MKKLVTLAAALTAAVPLALGALPAAAHTRADADPTASASVTVSDVTLRVRGEQVPMYVVAPDRQRGQRGHANAGILFMHWFAPGTVGADRTEYLAAAVRLAQRGTVSFLPEGHFPWHADPIGTTADADAIRGQLAVFRDLLGRLAARGDVDPGRIAVVGHDYGAMYGALLASDPRVHAAVLETPDATWENWFLKFWLGFEGDQATQYAATFAGLEPVDAVRGLGAHLFLQFADDDFFIPAEVRDQWAAAAPGAKLTVYPADHALTTAAQDDREAWLADELGLAG